MTLLTPGYWQSTIWPDNYWQTNNQVWLEGPGKITKNTRPTQNVHPGVMFQVHGSVGY